MASYLVTGVAGFVGAAVAARLLGAGHEVTGVDNLTTGFRENVPSGCVFLEGNCQDTTLYARLPQRDYAAIYHIAGQSSGEISFDDPVYDLQTNAQATLLLLKHALNSQCRRFLSASTMSVYGDQPDVPVAEDALALPAASSRGCNEPGPVALAAVGSAGISACASSARRATCDYVS